MTPSRPFSRSLVSNTRPTAARLAALLGASFLLGSPAVWALARPAIGPPGPASGPAAPTQGQAPPGLVLVEGGKTKLGTTPKEIEALIRANEDMANTLVAETPQSTVKVDPFFLMPTEVTNEQYAVFVQFAHIKPPYTWADEQALDSARRKFLEERGKAAQAARAEGNRIQVKKFDPEEWWNQVWRDTDWSLPESLAEHPATFVDYDSSLAYARWAGLRLPTEAEWTAAARGKTDSIFPWGDEWKALDKANTVEQPFAETRPVGSFPAGARVGIFDLAGNVWEWTSSPYTKLKGYKTMRVKIARGRQAHVIEALADWQPPYRVLKGGAYPNTLLAARVGTRMGGWKSQSTAGIGFRCAASTRPGQDTAAAALANDILMSALPPDVAFNPARTQVLQHWRNKPSKTSKRIESYAVIKQYQYALLFPAQRIAANGIKILTEKTVTEPVIIGVLSLSIPTMKPALDAGTFVVAYRAAGELPELDVEDASDSLPPTLQFTKIPGFDPSQDQFYFFDGQGAPISSMPATAPRFEKLAEGTATLLPFVPPKKPDEKNPVTPMDTLRFKVMTNSSNSRKGFAFTLPIGVEPGLVDDTWK